MVVSHRRLKGERGSKHGEGVKEGGHGGEREKERDVVGEGIPWRARGKEKKKY